VSSCSSIDKNIDEKKASKFFRGGYQFPKIKYSLKEVKGNFHMDKSETDKLNLEYKSKML
jgi:hypothetical protein